LQYCSRGRCNRYYDAVTACRCISDISSSDCILLRLFLLIRVVVVVFHRGCSGWHGWNPIAGLSTSGCFDSGTTESTRFNTTKGV
jgi:hypothetical protein